MTKTYSCLNDLPEQLKPKLHPSDGVIIPSPAYDLANQPVLTVFNDKIEQQWSQAETSESIFIAHGISFASQRRVLNAYFSHTDNLSAQQLIHFAPFIVLAVRQLISGSLIDVKPTMKSSCLTRNGMGFLLKVPPSCLYIASPVDANVPMERKGISQQRFREELCDFGKHECLDHSSRRLITLSPDDLLTAPKQGANYNEIAFVPRTTHPDQSIRIVGTFIDPSQSNMGQQIEMGDTKPPAFYYDCMLKLSHMLDLPCINLQQVKEQCDYIPSP